MGKTGTTASDSGESDMTIVIGIDLSGPANVEDTALVVLRGDERALVLEEVCNGIGDAEIFQLVARYAVQDALVVGIDAPLSYNPGGGDRPGDKALRKLLTRQGLASGTVMTPTMTRMAYLTLRGMGVARGIVEVGRERAGVAEVHPAAAMVLRGAPVQAVSAMKRDAGARTELLAWLEGAGLAEVGAREMPTDHYVAACGAALGGWGWSRGEHRWCEPAALPLHPFDFVA